MKGFRSMKKRVDSLNLVRVGLIFTIFLCHSGDMLPMSLATTPAP